MQQLKPIPQYEGLYSLTPDGLVWSHPNNRHQGKWKEPQISKGKKSPESCPIQGLKSTRSHYQAINQINLWRNIMRNTGISKIPTVYPRPTKRYTGDKKLVVDQDGMVTEDGK